MSDDPLASWAFLLWRCVELQKSENSEDCVAGTTFDTGKREIKDVGRERELLNDGRLTGVVCAGTGCILSFINQSGEEKQERVGREGKGSRLDRRDSSAHLKRHFLYSLKKVVEKKKKTKSRWRDETKNYVIRHRKPTNCYYCDVSDGMCFVWADVLSSHSKLSWSIQQQWWWLNRPKNGPSTWKKNRTSQKAFKKKKKLK